MLDSKNFTELTLRTNDFYVAGAIYVVILAAICSYAKNNFDKDRKKMAWIVSLFNSFFLLVLGCVYLAYRAPLQDGFFTYGLPAREMFHGVDNFSVLVCLWFFMANITDLLFGLAFYPKYLDPLTAYVHHSVFIWMMVACTTGNGGFIKPEPFAPAFCYMLIEELPTFLLALGSVFPAFRTDMGFGVTFFLFRLCYHVYFLTYSFIAGVETLVTVLYSLTFALHFFWFYTWVTKYGSKLFKKKDGDKVKKQS